MVENPEIKSQDVRSEIADHLSKLNQESAILSIKEKTQYTPQNWVMTIDEQKALTALIKLYGRWENSEVNSILNERVSSSEESVIEEAKQEENELKQELKDFDDYLKPLSKEQQKTCKTIVKQLNRVNMHSFFDWKQNNAITYVPKKEPLRGKEEKALEKLKELLLSEDPVIQQFFTLVEAQRWNNSFATKKDKNKIAQFDDFLTKQKVETEATTQQTETEKSDQLVQKLVLLLADTDMDGKIDALDQLITDDKWSRKKLEKTQKEQWRGTVSETQLESVITQSMKNLCDDEPGRNMVATNIVSYLKKLPQWPKETKVENMEQLVQILQTNPVLLWQIRNYARMMPEDFQTLLNWWVDAVVAHATQFDTSIEQAKEDEAVIAEYLTTKEWQRNTLAMMKALHEKFRGIQLFIDTEQQKILQANQWATPEQAKENAMKYHALQDAKDALDNKQWLRKSAIDLIYAWWLVSVIPDMQWAWAWVGVRFYEGKLTDFVNSIDMHLAGFQQLWWSKTTSLGLQMTVWGTIASWRKNTLFYALNGGVGMQLIQSLVWLGRNAGLTLGDELWINEKKMKSFDPVSKKFVWILAWASISGDFTSATVPFKPFSVHAWLYYRRDKLEWLKEQEAAVYMMVTEIVNSIKDPSLESIRKTVTEYCKTNKIKQSPEELDRVARVLHTALMPYTALVWKQSKETSRPTVVAEQVTRNRYNSQVEQAKSFAVTWVWLGVWVNFLGIYPQVWVQFEHRKEAVYMPDKDSERRIGELIATPWYEQKLTWTFSEQVENLNSRFGLVKPEDLMLSVPRDVAGQWEQGFVLVPDHIVGKQIDLRIAPNLIQNWVVWFQKKDNSYEIPADLPIKIVDIVENNQVRHVMVIGDIKWENAIPLTPEMQTATDDTWIINRLVEVERIYAGEMIKKAQESVAAFFQAHKDWTLPFVVNTPQDVGVNVHAETKKIESYTFPLKNNIKRQGEIPSNVIIDTQRSTITLPVNLQLNTIYSQKDDKYLLETKDHDWWISFGYVLETESFAQFVEPEANIDLLTVSPELDAFLRSTEGAEMLLDIRHAEWNKETTKKAFYKAIVDQNYQWAYQKIKKFIDKTSMKPLFEWITDRDARRADLYAIYGALSRVRMTEYKHLTDQNEKNDLLETLFDDLAKSKYTFSKLIDADKDFIRNIVTTGHIDKAQQPELVKILQKISKKFKGRWDMKYYYTEYPNRKDPFYKLMFLLAPVHDIYETRKTATKDRLKNEKGAQWFMSLYNAVGAALETKHNVFAENKPLAKHIGLVFGYESGNVGAWITEKFVFHPHTTGDQLPIPAEQLSASQDYFLNNYCKQNPKDVLVETTAIVDVFKKELADPAITMSEAEKQQKITALSNALFTNGKVNETIYKELQKTGTIKSLPWMQEMMHGTVERWMAAYSDCVNFMLTKWQPKFKFKFPKRYEVTAQPAVADVSLEKIRVSWPIVVSETIVTNTADRRASKYSAGIIAWINKKQYTTETSTTTPVDLTQEDFDKVTFDGWQTSVTISTTNTQVDAFPWKIWWLSGIFYADPNTGNWQFFEGNIAWTTFNPATNATLIPVADIMFTRNHYDAVNVGTLQMYMAARIKNVPYDAYRKQHEAYKKLTPEQQKKFAEQQAEKAKK